jgi:cell wall-associated NlpC family hydrolase
MRCAVELAPVRAEPAEDAEQVTQLLRLEPVRAEELRDGWARVVTAYDYPGWVLAEALEEGPGELPALADAMPLEVARRYLGTPYEWGGMTRAGIDCSGLVHMAYRATGRLVPRDSWQQEAAGIRIEEGTEEPGDVVVYGSPKRADHVSFWLGGETILHATARDGLGVVEEPEPPELRARRRRIVRLGVRPYPE